MKTKKILSLLLVAVIVLLTASCTTKVVVEVPGEYFDSLNSLLDGSVQVNGGNNSQSTPENTTSAPVENTTSAPVENTTSAPVENTTSAPVENTTSAPVENTTSAPVENTTSAPVENTTSAPVENTTSAPVENTTSAPVSNKAPSSKAEIIAYYCTAYNKLATDNAKITRTYDYTSNYNNICQVGDNQKIADLASSLMTQFMVENTEAIEVSAADLPPKTTTNLSISADKISSATCTDKGTYYEVVLKSTGTDSNYEIDSPAGTGSAGSIGPVLDPADVSGAVPESMVKFEGLHTWYGTATATAHIDKATGHMTYLEYNSPAILHFDKVTALFVIKVENCNLGLLFQQKYTITY